jgi:transcriptional regulator with XRE-family HTH domain
MHLSKFMKDRKLSDEAVAIAIGPLLRGLKPVSRATVSRWRRGKIIPDWDAIERIKAFSGGLVVEADWAKAHAERAQRAEEVQP